MLAALSLLAILFLNYRYGFSPYLIVIALPSLALIAIAETHRRGEEAKIIGSVLNISDQKLYYKQPATGYELSKNFAEIERSHHKYFLGCPILTVYFEGNQKLSFVALDESGIAYEKIQVRTNFRT